MNPWLGGFFIGLAIGCILSMLVYNFAGNIKANRIKKHAEEIE